MRKTYKLLVILASLAAVGVWGPVAGTGSACELGESLYLMGEERQAECYEVLVAALDHPTPYIRRIAAHALGKLGNPMAQPHLIRIINDDRQPVMVRCVAMKALIRLGGPAVQPAIQPLCDHEQVLLRKKAKAAMKQYAATH